MSNIPIDFDWKFYTSYYPELGDLNQRKAEQHYLRYGQEQERIYKPSLNRKPGVHYKNIPEDVFTRYIYKDSNFILVEDPKHTQNSFHYTIWSIREIKNILYLCENDLENLKLFIKKIQKNNLFCQEKMYFTYPPTHNHLHLHIVPENYTSYRKLDELYNFDEIYNYYDNIKKINNINSQKNNSVKLRLRFNIGLFVLEDIEKIHEIKDIKEKKKLDYIVVIRNINKDKFIELLIDNYQIINVHIYTNNKFHLYKNMINHDYYFILKNKKKF